MKEPFRAFFCCPDFEKCLAPRTCQVSRNIPKANNDQDHRTRPERSHRPAVETKLRAFSVCCWSRSSAVAKTGLVFLFPGLVFFWCLCRASRLSAEQSAGFFRRKPCGNVVRSFCPRKQSPTSVSATTSCTRIVSVARVWRAGAFCAAPLFLLLSFRPPRRRGR